VRRRGHGVHEAQDLTQGFFFLRGTRVNVEKCPQAGLATGQAEKKRKTSTQ